MHAEGLPNFPLGIPSIIHCSKGQDPSPFQHVWVISPEPRAPKAEMGFLNSLHAAHPTPRPCSHQRSALSPQGSAMFACLPTQAVTTTHSYSALVMRGSSQRGLEEMGWASVEHSGIMNQVAQNSTLLFQAAEMTLWIIYVRE